MQFTSKKEQALCLNLDDVEGETLSLYIIYTGKQENKGSGREHRTLGGAQGYVILCCSSYADDDARGRPP